MATRCRSNRRIAQYRQDGEPLAVRVRELGRVNTLKLLSFINITVEFREHRPAFDSGFHPGGSRNRPVRASKLNWHKNCLSSETVAIPSSKGSEHMLNVREITDLQQLAAIEEPWHRLLAETTDADFFRTFTWLKVYCSILGKTNSYGYCWLRTTKR